ncbi:MAG: glutamine--fructose-6-phosphate aminotransferase, partial [Hymenobacter sp.]
MCGIVAYLGHREACPIILKGLHRLEYRGYDSAGVALLNGNLSVYKKKGKVADLEGFLVDKDTHATVGMGHTRWATHGEPNDVNAHPHYSTSERIAIIHNGIIENYAALKTHLMQQGHVFHSDTDTEVFVNLIEEIQKQNECTLEEAVRLALHEVIGAYAIVVLSKDAPDQLIAARKGSPLVIGIGEGEFFVASDATPIIEYTNEVVYVNDHELAVIRDGQLAIRSREDVV